MISLEKRDTLVVYGGEFFKNGTYLLVTTTIKASIVMQKSSFSPWRLCPQGDNQIPWFLLQAK